MMFVANEHCGELVNIGGWGARNRRAGARHGCAQQGEFPPKLAYPCLGFGGKCSRPPLRHPGSRSSQALNQ